MFKTTCKAYFVLFHCTIFYKNYNYVMAVMGPNVREVHNNEFPGVVSIMRLRNTTETEIEIHHKCTGTLVSRQDVITAEHCLRTTFTENFKVMIGSRDLREAIVFFPIFIWTYEHWQRYRQRNQTSKEDDIAFVKISSNIPENIQFAPNANMPNENLYGLHVDVAGWGMKPTGEKSRILRTGKVQIMTYFQCQRRYFIMTRLLAHIHDKFLCSMENPYTVLTEGDSGGPVFFFGTLVAISKGVFPVGDAGPFQPNLMNLHMSLRYYRTFFNDVLTTFHLNL